MKLYSWNVNSLRSCEDKFLEFLDKYSPDIVAIQELRATEDQISFFLKGVSGYKYLFNDSGRPGYAGTALYYKDSLGIDPKRALGNTILDGEGRVIYTKIGDIHFFNFYIPNGGSSEDRLKFKLQYYSEVTRQIKDLCKNNEKVIVGGDFNVAHTNADLYLDSCNHSGFLPEEKKWFDEMLNLGFFDSFRHFYKERGYYTWWHMRDPERERNNGWRFDYFLVSNNLKEQTKSAGILRDVYGSDHCPIWVEIES
jgi:exodeoxyribonuclease-3